MAEVIRLGGYYGGAKIAGSNVLLTSGNVANTLEPAMLTMVSTPKSGMVGPVIHADGIETFTANMSFELYSGSSGAFSSVIRRGEEISFMMSDGYNGAEGKGYVTSASFSVQSGGIIAGSVSLTCKDEIKLGHVDNTYLGTEIPMGYWTSGIGKVCGWSFEMSQEAQPMYANKDETKPHYIKIGNVTYTLNVDSYEKIEASTEVDSTKNFNLGIDEVTIIGSITEAGYSHGGQNGLGTYSYRFVSGSTNGRNNMKVLS